MVAGTRSAAPAVDANVRVLYGVTGEGMGHAMRSRVIAAHLVAAGHEVKLVASGRAVDYLRRYFDDVLAIPGLSIVYDGAEVRRLRTLVAFGRSVRPSLREIIALYRRSISGFQPHACITDFDSFSHVFGLLFDRPVISIDHQHVIDRCEHDREITARVGLASARAIVRAKLPRCRHYVVTSYYFPRVRTANTTLVGPILRPEILACRPTRGEHVLVYQTSIAPDELITALRAVPEQRFVVFDRVGGTRVGNVEIRRFDEHAFVDHLASARAVITNGGYTTIAEALYLGKPVLAIPLRHQGEQLLNAAYLEASGLGLRANRLDRATIVELLAARASATRITAGNTDAFGCVDRLLEEAA
jgi:uncharacterized protein (TIGR00661 family)